MSQWPVDQGAVMVGPYRYLLWRTTNFSGSRKVLFIMLNPSTAGAEQDDPTVRRCIGFARRWGYAHLEICNLFALRATNPRLVVHAPDPVGPENDLHIASAATRADMVLAAWGIHGGHLERDKQVLAMLKPRCALFALKRTLAGHPGHPLYVRASAMPKLFRGLGR
jgi:hypothetical protein